MSDLDGDDDSRNLLDKADEFLKRRRAQLGNPMTETGLNVPHPEAADDIPVLTEVVGREGIAPNHSAATERDLGADVARQMSDWLDENLPQVVMHALDGITDRLIAEIHESARTELLPRLKRTLNEGDEPGEK